MNNIQALYNLRVLLNERYRIANRDKENDAIYEESYDTILDLIDKQKRDFIISEQLMMKIKAGELTQYNCDDYVNGYYIRVSITKNKKQKTQK